MASSRKPTRVNPLLKSVVIRSPTPEDAARVWENLGRHFRDGTAIAGLMPAQRVSLLSQMLSSPDESIRVEAINVFNLLAADRKKLGEDIAKTFGPNAVDRRYVAAEENTAESVEAILPKMKEMLVDGSVKCRIRAGNALIKYYLDEKDWEQAFGLLGHQSEEVRWSAACEIKQRIKYRAGSGDEFPRDLLLPKLAALLEKENCPSVKMEMADILDLCGSGIIERKY